MGKKQRDDEMFNSGHWLSDTRCLTLAEKGAWIDILCALWRSPTRGTATLAITEWARLLGATVEQTVITINGLIARHVMDSLHGSNSNMAITSSLKSSLNLTLSSRRILREEEKKKLNRARVQKHRGVLCDEEFIATLKTSPAYTGIDIDKELSKMDMWFLTPKGTGRSKTRRFIIAWLNRAEKPMTAAPVKPRKYFTMPTEGKL